MRSPHFCQALGGRERSPLVAEPALGAQGWDEAAEIPRDHGRLSLQPTSNQTNSNGGNKRYTTESSNRTRTEHMIASYIANKNSGVKLIQCLIHMYVCMHVCVYACVCMCVCV